MKNLKLLRQNLMKTQGEVARNLNIPMTTYANYEQNKAFPSADTLIKIADYFGCSVDYLLNHQTQNTVQMDSLSASQRQLLDDIRDLSEENCQRVQDFIYGISIAERKKQEAIQKFKTKGE